MHDSLRLEGRTALVTGASTGIGAAFATELAKRGANLVLVARSAGKLEELATSLRSRFTVDVATPRLDLAEREAAERLFQYVTDLGTPIDFLVNNAGVGHRGRVAASDPGQMAALVDLNVRAVLGITIRFLPGMISRGHGTIINVSSNGAFQPAPYMAAYSASKAFVLSFTQAVSAETAGTGVRVLALCPGPTDTPMTAGKKIPAIAGMRTPEQVVATAFKALPTRKTSVVDGKANAFFARVVSKRFPEPIVLNLARRVIPADGAPRQPVA
ncbi:SDR family NAD(P)-dependent oxidoreductase [Nonomuraea lactucae]|uniref:SDR family NAD(P)-dependent oxidoreductase n=1 Tax=Nonomuraea lactucae TaxID=2249762 RepID=UPI000DE2653E|nr:SDR family oxidoreductase [Nonomuraea lactucae]